MNEQSETQGPSSAIADPLHRKPQPSPVYTPFRTAVRAARTERLEYVSSFRPMMIPIPSSVPPHSAEPAWTRPLRIGEVRTTHEPGGEGSEPSRVPVAAWQHKSASDTDETICGVGGPYAVWGGWVRCTAHPNHPSGAA